MGIRALLVQNPATSPWIAQRQWEPPSVALATIAAQIDGHDVRVADAVVWRKRAVKRFLDTLARLRPTVVGFSAMTFQYDTALRFAALARRFDPGVLTCLGGYHATLFAEEIAAAPDAGYWDFLVRGEGDLLFGELLDAVASKAADLGGILGLSWKRDGRFVHNARRPLEDLDRLRIPARDKRITRGFHMYFRPADVIETSRGCVHACSFCSIREMYGKSFRVFPRDRVLADIEDAYSRGARHILCTDDNITLDMDRFEDLLDGVISLKLSNLAFTTQASPSGFAARPGIAAKMVEAGFVSVFLGIENVSAKSLRAMHKPNTVETIRRGVAELLSRDINVSAGLINGLAHDDQDSIRENYEFVKSLGVSSVMDQLLTPYPKTPLREEMIASGLVANRDDFRWYDGYFQQRAHRTPVGGAARLPEVEDAARGHRDVASHAGRLEVPAGLRGGLGIRPALPRVAERTDAGVDLRRRGTLQDPDAAVPAVERLRHRHRGSAAPSVLPPGLRNRGRPGQAEPVGSASKAAAGCGSAAGAAVRFLSAQSLIWQNTS